jgi:DNA-binding MarR family transcriptional regulator
MSRIARESSLSSGGLTKVADKLVALGLARRVPAADDRRVIYIELTSRGQALADRIEKRTAEVLRRTMLAELGVAEAQQLSESMRRLRDAG